MNADVRHAINHSKKREVQKRQSNPFGMSDQNQSSKMVSIHDQEAESNVT